MLANAKLLFALNEIICQANGALKEYEIISMLQKSPYRIFEPEALSDPLRLFQCHFVLFHHLYLLQDRYLSENRGYLTIHTTEIDLNLSQVSDMQLNAEDKLRQYYLDWANFENTDVDHVEDLLKDFWRRMGNYHLVNEDEKHRATEILKLPEVFSQSQLKAQYRKLQHQFHPDKKGGDASLSQEVEWAYRILKQSSKLS